VANITTRKPSLALKLRDEIQGSPESHGLLPDGSIEEIIREGAKIMIEADAHRLQVKQKAGTANFVTEYDVRVQHFLEEKLKALIPECEFLAEEEGESDNPVGDGYTFVIDPIDGTTNFMLGRRASCISVALLKNKKPVYGAIFDPYSNRYYSAHPEGGAYCNHRKIAVSDRHPSVGIASLGTSPYNRDTMAKPVTEIAYGLLMNFGDIRRIGSAALELCAVACGELDVYCEPILSPWDFAAGKLILCEAGGVATDFDGNELSFDGPTSVLATTPASRDAALNVVKGKI
jgi:myo-inositol-1(or 4)-monophosphatase